ncbi:MAG: hypothetical protein PHO02_04080 [Candidatus Nanoarchaeia archaeon]|nr:hypothetical protein [Candidatus Nanoarchaeia archaeon]
MRKGLIAIVCAALLLVSIAAAQIALPTKMVQATDASIAKNVASTVQANAYGLKTDKGQCVCSADTLAKIAQIKKLLAELEASCNSGMIIENPGRGPVIEETCFGKCMAENKGYCESTCKDENGNVDSACYGECANAIKVKCENSCNIPSEEVKPAEPDCASQCLAKNFDKEECLKPCYVDGVEDRECYDACSKKSEEVWDMCQKQCRGQETPSNEAPDVLGQCSASCEIKYSECKEGCYAGVGIDAAKLKIAEECTVNQCMPVLKECSASCNAQYGKKENLMQKFVNVFKPAQYRNAKWICHDGTESVEGGETSCKPGETWTSYAKQACEGKCSTETNKCGVNTFMVYNEC